MSPRPKHQRPELEAVFREAEAKGWRVTRQGKYFTMKCGCPDKHMKTVHLTPSNPYYLRNLLGQLRRATCWEEADR